MAPTYASWRQSIATPDDLNAEEKGVPDRALNDSFDPGSLPEFITRNNAFRESLNAKFGTNATSQQSLRYVLNMAGPVYLPVHFIATQIARAKPKLFKNVSHANDLDGREALPGQDLMYDLFRRPAPNTPFCKILYQASQQQDLTGESVFWLPPENSETGEVSDWEPLEMHVLPTACIVNILRRFLPNPSGLGLSGSFDETLVVSSHSLGYATGAGSSFAGGVFHIPAKHCIRIDNPHPYLLNNAFSPLQALGQWVDVLRGIDQARINNQRQGFHQLFGIILGEEFNDGKAGGIERFRKEMLKRFGGVGGIGGLPIFPAGTEVARMGPRPDEMDWPQQYEQISRNLSAALNLNPSVTGVIDTNFSALHAAIKQLHYTCLSPRIEWFASVLSQQLLQRVYGPEYFMEFELPRIDEDDRMKEAATWATSCGLMTVAEARRVADMLGLKLDELSDAEAPWVLERAWGKQGPAGPGAGSAAATGQGGEDVTGQRPAQPEKADSTGALGERAKGLFNGEYLLDRLGRASKNGHATYHANGKAHAV